MLKNKILDAIKQSNVSDQTPQVEEMYLKTDLPDDYYETALKRLIKLCATHQVTPDELLSVLGSGVVDKQLKMAFQTILGIEQSDNSEVKTYRNRAMLPAPERRADSEANRLDSRLIARLPLQLIQKFNCSVASKPESTAKGEFQQALEAWLLGEPSDEVVTLARQDQEIGDKPFQVRISNGMAERINAEVNQRKITKKEAISQVLAMHHLDFQ